MIGALKGVIASVLKQVIIAAVSERVLKMIVIEGAEKLAKKTENTLDDKIVAEIREALGE